MSEIRVDRFKAEDGISAPQFPNGIQVTGVVTATVLDTSVSFLTVGSNAQAGASGIVTAKGADINGDIDVDGHTELDNVNIAGVATVASAKISDLTDNRVVIAGSNGELEDSGNLTFDGSTLAVTGDATFSGKVSVGATLTYEDVTNIDSVGLITARNGVSITSGGLKVLAGGSNFNATITGTATTATTVSVANEGSDTETFVTFTPSATGNQSFKTNTGLKFNSANGTLTATSFAGNGANLTGVVAVPTGAIMAWPTESIPSGFLKCQGQAIARSTYSDLFSAIGVIYGAGDGSSTFNIPDYRGEFLRGRAEGSANDPDRASRTNRGDGNGGDNVGTKQDYAILNHSHGNNSGGQSNHGYNNNSNNTGTFSKSGHGYSANQCHSYEIVHSMSYGTNYANVNGHVTNNEVRPRNVYVHWIIKT